jgi:hypothetical protein
MFINRGILNFLILMISALLHLPPLKFQDAVIDPRTVATLAVRRSNDSARSQPNSARSHLNSARSHPHSDRAHPHSARSHRHSDRSHPHSAIDLIHIRLDLIHTQLDLIHTRPVLNLKFSLQQSRHKLFIEFYLLTNLLDN